jgi:transcriptional regulator with XRE-family HTH domain
MTVTAADRLPSGSLETLSPFCFNGALAFCQWQGAKLSRRAFVALPRADATLMTLREGGVVAGTDNPTARRRELGNMLRAMRLARGLTVEQVADHLLVSPSKISRLETGQRGALARDIRDLARLYELGDEDQQLLTELAEQGKQRAWWQSFNLPYSAYVGLEADATTIMTFNLAILPGLFQTEAYARVTLEKSFGDFTEARLQELTRVRMERQARVLHSGGESPCFTAILDEAVLRRRVGGSAVMRDQLKSLRESAQLPNVTLRVVPFGAGALPVATNMFVILRFSRASMPDIVLLETLTGELILESAEELRRYNAAFAEVTAMAASEAETLELIASLERDYSRP